MRTRFALLFVVLGPLVALAGFVAPRLLGVPPDARAIMYEPDAIGAHGDPIGVWQVVWDRSDVGWSPPLFNGTMIIKKDGLRLWFRENRSYLVTDEIHFDGPHVDFKVRWERTTDSSGEIVGTVLGDLFLGYLRYDDDVRGSVRWSPITAHRINDEIPPSVAPKPLPNVLSF